jgi:exopolyphosphatase/guanosine-5'-triphosphate,3'-diphosphate pyrophosphatase
VDIRRPEPDMRIAAIDIGTNTILMLVADVAANGSLTCIRDEHHIARLGKGVDANGMIQEETFHRVRGILGELKSIADASGVEHVVACGTSALRDAVNRDEFLAFINLELGLDIRVISGEEEAELTYLGSVSDYYPVDSNAEYAVLDIGGGSTELVSGTGTGVRSALSMDMGSVRITERILKKNPPTKDSVEEATQFIRQHILKLTALPAATKLLGVAGTLTTLAALDLNLKEFDREAVNRYILSRETIERILHELLPLSLDQLKAYPQIHPQRADILVAGILILKEVLAAAQLQKIAVSDRGLRYGIALKAYDTFSRD